MTCPRFLQISSHFRFQKFAEKLDQHFNGTATSRSLLRLARRRSPSPCLSVLSAHFLSGSSCQRCPIVCTPAAWSSFIPRAMVGITLRNAAARQLRAFPLLLLDKGLSSMLLGPLGKPKASILMLYHPGLWLSQSDDVIFERRDVMEAQKICFCEDLQMRNCSAHADAAILWNIF